MRCAALPAGAAVLLRDHAVLPHHIGFSVPNRTWAVQLAQACKVMGVRACIAEAGEVPSGSAAVIFDFRAPKRNVEWLFVVGCTEGLMPTAAATGDDKASPGGPRGAARRPRPPCRRRSAPCGALLFRSGGRCPGRSDSPSLPPHDHPRRCLPCLSDSHALHQRDGSGTADHRRQPALSGAMPA